MSIKYDAFKNDWIDDKQAPLPGSGSGSGETSSDNHLLADGTALGASHYISGAADGEVLRASSATTAKFDQLKHSDLNKDESDPHSGKYGLIGTPTSVTATWTFAAAIAIIIAAGATFDMNGTADYSDAEAITYPTASNVFTGAGAGTGLDADKLDGQEGAAYVRNDITDIWNYAQKAITLTYRGQVGTDLLTVSGTEDQVCVGCSTGPAKFTVEGAENQLSLVYDDGTQALHADTSVDANGNLLTATTGDMYLNIKGGDIYPGSPYSTNIGGPLSPFLALWASELHLQTLVAEDVRSTIGGHIVVSPTTTLTRILSDDPTDVEIEVEHNEMAIGDTVRLEAYGSVEFLSIDSAPSGTGPYTYDVTRNLDGSGLDIWVTGTAVVNTGAAGDGWIDLFSGTGSFGGTGPAISITERLSTTYNDWESRAAFGNLNGLFNVASNVYGIAFGDPSAAYIQIDEDNGYRIFKTSSNVIGQWDKTGDFTLGEIGAGKSNFHYNFSSSTFDGRVQTTPYFRLDAANKTLRIGEDASSDTKTYFTAFAADTTSFGGETFDLGDLLIGSNATGKGNIHYDHSTGRLDFAGGTGAAQAYIDTDGTITAGGGIVQINATGINIDRAAGDVSASAIEWIDTGDSEIVGRLNTYHETTGAFNNMRLISQGETTVQRSWLTLESDGTCTGCGEAKIVLYSDDGRPTGAEDSVGVSADEIYLDASTGINIGTNPSIEQPGATLDVRGDVRAMAASGSTGTLTMATEELTVVDGDRLGRIDFKAPLESSGGDAIAIAAAIWAEANATFSSTVNTTHLIFATGSSSAALERVRITEAGDIGVGNANPDAKMDMIVTESADGILIDNTAITGDPILGFQLSGTPTFTMGIDDSDSDKFKIGTSAVETNTRMTIDSSGKIGIGTSTPAAKLDVNGDVIFGDTAPNQIRALTVTEGSAGVVGIFEGSNSSYAILDIDARGGVSADPTIRLGDSASYKWVMGYDNSDADKFKIGEVLGFSSSVHLAIDTSGNVGIGTSSPSNLLEISSSDTSNAFAGNATITITNTNTAAFGRHQSIAFGYPNSIGAGISGIYDNWNPTNKGGHVLAFFTKNSALEATPQEKMRIDKSGNVGIGTTTPAAKLDVAGGDIRLDNGQGITSDAGASIKTGPGGGTYTVTAGASSMLFIVEDSSGADKLTIDTSGNVGIGTTTPDELLDVSDNLNAIVQVSSTKNDAAWNVGDVIGGIGFYSADVSGSFGAGIKSSVSCTQQNSTFGGYTDLRFGTSFTDGNNVTRMVIKRDGDTGIGTTGPTRRLVAVKTSAANDVFEVQDSSGTCNAQPTTGGLTWACSSSRALKTDIRDAAPVLGDLDLYHIRDYTVRATGETMTGVIAEELRQVHSEMVSDTGSGLQAGTPNIWELVKAIQELSEENRQLRLRLDALERRN